MAQMVKEECRQTLYQDYVSMCVKILAESYVKCHGGEINLPSFIEMTHEQEREPTAKEIIDHVKKIFSAG